MPLWHRLVVIGAVLLVTVVVARIIDRRIARRELAPETRTRYRVLRRSVATAVVAVGVLSALLVIPQVRAVAGGLLASSAVVGIVIGFASQRTIGNFVAGLLIAFTQPLRLGDRVEVGGQAGVVEEIGLTYTFIRVDDDTRLVIPNEKLASDTIRNATIRARHALAEISLQVPLDRDLGRIVEVLRETAPPDAEVLITGLDGNATVTLRTWTPDATSADRVASDLRLRAHERLRAAGVYA
ncbi:MAG TPA: mechanosensitive ion channel domain-containing protein [Gaiellaceae bacterium]|jgi:small-conductance mechanosensitive channel|nr:mechanosensitive ion channel domain-containing protein [Gaiellaceae bacterium]